MALVDLAHGTIRTVGELIEAGVEEGVVSTFLFGRGRGFDIWTGEGEGWARGEVRVLGGRFGMRWGCPGGGREWARAISNMM